MHSNSRDYNKIAIQLRLLFTYGAAVVVVTLGNLPITF